MGGHLDARREGGAGGWFSRNKLPAIFYADPFQRLTTSLSLTARGSARFDPGMISSSGERQIRQATLLEMARDLCAVIERDELTREESLEVLTGLRALLEVLSVPPHDLQH